MRTRDEHVEWCKEQARPYLVRDDITGAITSMLCDLAKHPETKAIAEKMAILGIHYAAKGDIRDARYFIEGFR